MKNLALCMIAKGSEWEETKRCLDAVADYVDTIFITTTKEATHPEYPNVVWSHFPWVEDFAKARSFNFEQAQGYRFVLWLDTDDVLQNSEVLPDVIKQMKTLRLDGIYCDYNYNIDKDTGEVIIVHPRERIVINDGSFEWKGALHETLVSKREVRTKFIKDIFVNHYPSEESHKDNLKRNLEIMATRYRQEAKELHEGKRTEIDPRTEYYLGRILFDTNTKEGYIRAAELFQDYLQHSGWDEERAQAWHYLARIFMLQQAYDDAISCCLSAKKESNRYPTWDVLLANVYCAMGQFDKAKIAITQALSLEQPSTSLIVSPQDDKINSLLVLFLISFHEKDLNKALKYAEGMYEVRPSKDNKERIETVSELLKIGDWMKAMGTMVADMGKDYERIKTFLSSVPKKMENTVYVRQLHNDYLPPKTWPKKSVVYYAASDFENWSPKALETGIGGSEEAIIYLCKEWVKLGYEVTVYAKVGNQEGIYDGVQYLNYQKFNPHDHFSVLVGWRNPLLFKYNTFSARITLLDLHDVPQPNDYTIDVLTKVDFIMVKSQFHRSLLPQVPDSKFVIIGNGIDTEKLAKIKGKHKRYKIFWGSSYDRGLENMLVLWPDIRKAEPLAELHVCYGWTLFDKVYEHLPHMKKWRKQMEQLMTQPGVIHHGRVGKKELYEVAADCGTWAYPTEFEEIDCITARYTQALGTLPVVSDYAALQTTVHYGYKIPHASGHIDKTAFQNKLIEVITDTSPSTVRESMRTFALENFTWERVAKRWEQVFDYEPAQDVKVSIITPTIRTGFWNVMAQNLALQKYQNFEWIIVDDYEEDRSDIAKEYAKKYDLNIKYLRPGKRTAKEARKYGLSSANNYGWKHSTGELCIWLQDFVLIEPDAIEKLVHLYRHNPYSFIAPVDRYYEPKQTPNLDNKVDWFNGETDIKGKWMRDNARIEKGWLRESEHIYDLELNFGAMPKKLLQDLNGFWEFYDEALGYDDTEIVYRGFQLGATLIIDETNVCSCIDHWGALKGTKENGEDREHNLNDPRFVWMVQQMEEGKLDATRSQEIDDSITLKYEIPKETTQDGAVVWMKEHLEEIVKGWSL